jgi:hypothetical protein
MGTLIDIGLLIIVGAAVIATAYYITAAAVQVADIPNYATDPNLSKAHRYLAYSASFAWTSIVLIVIAIVLFIIYGEELVMIWGGWLLTLLLFLLLAILFTMGVIAIIASIAIRDSGQFTAPPGSIAYKDAIIASVISIGLVATMFIFVVVQFTIRYRRNARNQEAQRRLRRLRTRQEIEQLSTM